MTPQTKKYLAGAIVIGAALYATRGTATGSVAHVPASGNAAWVRQISTPAAVAMGMPGLEDFLMAKAYTESRFNPAAGSCTNNRACGLFGLRSDSALVPEHLLEDPRWAVLGAADYAWRVGHKYAFPGQVVTWGALARGWALPGLVADVDWSKDRSQDVLDRWEEALDAVGLPHSFTDRPAFPPGARHPGKAALAAALGLGGVA